MIRKRTIHISLMIDEQAPLPSLLRHVEAAILNWEVDVLASVTDMKAYCYSDGKRIDKTTERAQ